MWQLQANIDQRTGYVGHFALFVLISNSIKSQVNFIAVVDLSELVKMSAHVIFDTPEASQAEFQLKTEGDCPG